MSDININIKLVSKAAETSLNSFGNAATTANRKLSIFEKAANQVSRSLDSFYGNLGANLAFRAFNQLITGINNTVTNFRNFEQALVGVGKTTGLSGQELAELGERIEDLSRRIPVASTELLGLAQTAAQLGIRGSDNIEKFVDTMARLAVSTDIVGEEGALAFARIINVTGESVQNIDRLGASIVELGNNFATTESQILTVANEVAKGGGRFGITAGQVLALSTTLSSLGVEAQVAGSTVQKVLATIEKAIGSGGAELDKFTKILGITDEELISLFASNPTELFLRLNEGLAEATKGGANLSKELERLGFNDLRVTKTLGPLITRTDELRRALELQTGAYAENTALITESDAAFSTLNSQLQNLENNWIAFTNALVESVVPAISLTIGAINSFIDAIRENAEDLVTTAKIFGIVAASISPFVLAMYASTLATTVFSPALLAANAALTTTGFTFVGVTNAIRIFWLTLLGPTTLAIAGIVAIGAAVFLLVKYWDNVLLSIKRVFLATKELVGIQDEQLSAEVRRLERKIELQDKVNEGLKAEIKAETDLQQLRNEQQDLRKAFGGGGFITQPGKAEAEERERLEQERLQKLIENKQKEFEILKQFGQQQTEFELARLEQALLLDGEKSAADDLALQFEADRLATRLENKQIALARELGLEKDAQELSIKAKAEQIKRENALTLAQAEFNKKQREEELRQRDSFLTLAAGLARSENKTLAAIGKAAALTQIAIKTPAAVGNAYEFGTRFGGPVLGAVFAGIASAAMAAQAAQIAGVSFEQGGIVPGTSFSGDRVQANVNSGEMILNRQQQAKLFDLANGGSGDGQMIQVTSIVQIDETEIARAVSRQVAQGVVLGEGGV